MEIKEIPLKQINFRANVRQTNVLSDQSQLMQSIKREGLMQPIGIKTMENKKGFYIVWGHRRHLAFQKLGYKTIPAIIVEGDDLTEEEFIIKNVSENVQRNEITSMELGRICKFLRKTMSESEIASKLSIPLSRVKMSIKVYSNIPLKVQKQIKIFTNAGTSTKREGKIPFHIATQISQMRDLTIKQKEKVYEIFRKEELKLEHIKVLANLLKNGFSFDKAVKELTKYHVVNVKFAIRKTALDRIADLHTNIQVYARGLINKEHPKAIPY